MGSLVIIDNHKISKSTNEKYWRKNDKECIGIV